LKQFPGSLALIDLGLESLGELRDLTAVLVRARFALVEALRPPLRQGDHPSSERFSAAF
jgi:hypothetical protein